MKSIETPEAIVMVPLSKLIAGKHNPRRVKPQRDAHRQMTASIRAHGLLEPLVVRPDDKTAGTFKVIAGERRLSALREVHKDKPATKVPCVLRTVDEDAASALSLAENFIRQPMHPLDEAEAFAKLAREDAKGVDDICASFGVSAAYVRQRMKLATLADVVKAAYRDGTIDTATAEAFASVPADRQLEVWKELNGSPQHAQHVRNVIAHAWIDGKAAIFDLSKLPAESVSSDLFSQRVLVERSPFMEAQTLALQAERTALLEEGWSEVAVGPQGDVQDKLWSMARAPFEYDQPTTARLKKLSAKREKLEGKLDAADEQNAEPIQDQLAELDAEEEELKKSAKVHYPEPVRAAGTVFLMLDPDGRVRREYRIPRQRLNHSGSTGNGQLHAGGDGAIAAPAPLTSEDLKDSQLATTFTHQALAVREAVLKDARVCRRVLALILHEHVHSEALSVQHQANGSTLHADMSEGFSSVAHDALRRDLAEFDPLHGQNYVRDDAAFEALRQLPETQLNQLIDLLTVRCITAHLQRPTPLVCRLARELDVNIRRYWKPDEKWLSAYQKIQLSHLLTELRGPSPEPADRKKSELVAELAKLFTDAAEGTLEDSALAEKVNAWLPANLREPQADLPDEATPPPEQDNQAA